MASAYYPGGLPVVHEQTDSSEPPYLTQSKYSSHHMCNTEGNSALTPSQYDDKGYDQDNFEDEDHDCDDDD
jgi:hypothetical protein